MTTDQKVIIRKRGRIDFEKQEKRDKEILFFLYCGIGHFSHIHNAIFKNGKGLLLHKRTAQRRIKFLLENDYIKQKRYKSIRERKGRILYALSERGIYELCNSFSLNPDFARSLFPATNHVAHEAFLSDIFRTVYGEVSTGRYSIDHIYDDREMKRLTKKKSGRYFPDAHVTIIPHSGNALTFNIEVDAGHKGPKYIRAKIASWKAPTLILALNQRRLDQIRNYISEFNNQYTVGFALAGEFIRKGFSNSEWLWHPSGDKAKIDIR